MRSSPGRAAAARIDHVGADHAEIDVRAHARDQLLARLVTAMIRIKVEFLYQSEQGLRSVITRWLITCTR